MSGKLRERKMDPEVNEDREAVENCNRCGRRIADDAEYYMGLPDEDFVPYWLCGKCWRAASEEFGDDWHKSLGATKSGVRRFSRWVQASQPDGGKNWRSENR